MTRLAFVFEAKQSGECSTEVSPTLRSMNYAGSHLNGGGQLAVVEVVVAGHKPWREIVRKRLRRPNDPELTKLAARIWGTDLSGDAYDIAERLYAQGVRVVGELVPFDRSQITHPENRSNPQPGDPSPTLKSDGKPPHVIGFHSTGGSQGVGAGDDVSPTLVNPGSTGLNVPAAYAFKPSHYTRGKDGPPSETFPPLTADADKGDQDPLVYVIDRQNATAGEDLVGTLDTAQENARGKAVYDAVTVMAPRRLTPVECARLQGFEDTWLDVGSASDSAKYRALGNAVAVPCVEWIARRIVVAHREIYGGY